MSLDVKKLYIDEDLEFDLKVNQKINQLIEQDRNSRYVFNNIILEDDSDFDEHSRKLYYRWMIISDQTNFKKFDELTNIQRKFWEFIFL